MLYTQKKYKQTHFNVDCYQYVMPRQHKDLNSYFLKTLMSKNEGEIWNSLLNKTNYF